MANFLAIEVVGRAIVGVLQNALPKPVFPLIATSDIKLCQASDYLGTGIKQGITVLLYNAAVNTGQRNMMTRTKPDGSRNRLALPVDLHYLMTVWATNPEEQHRLMGWMIRTLEDNTELPSGLLNSFTTDKVFAANESVQLTYEVASLSDQSNIMQVFIAQQKPPQLSATYMARAVALESPETVTQAPNVQTREFDFVKPLE